MVPVELDLDVEARGAGAQHVRQHRRRRAEGSLHAHHADQRPGLDDLDRPGRQPLGIAADPRLDVPRVVPHRLVDGQLEHGPELAGRQQLAAAGDVDDRAQVAVEIPRHRHAAVLHRAVGDDDAVGRSPAAAAAAMPSPGTRARNATRPSARRWTAPSGRFDGGDDDLVALDRRRVGQHGSRRRRARRQTAAMRSSRSAAMRANTSSASACTQAIDEPGMMSWNWSVSTSCHSASRSGWLAGCRRPQLGLAQQPLAAPVAELRAQLAGQRAAMGLEVQLAAPHRHRRAGGDLGVDVVEELGGRALLDARHAVEVGEPAQPLEHLAGRPATAVAVAERHQRPAAPLVLGEAARPSRPARRA